VPIAFNHSSPLGNDVSVFELDGRLTLVQERNIDWVVPHEIADRDETDLETVNNPINQLGAIHSDCVPIVTSNDRVSYLAAVNKRSNALHDKDKDNVTDEVYELYNAITRSMPNLFEEWDENEADREEWLSKFDTSKRNRMEAAWLNVDQATLKDLTQKTGSVKIEALNGKRFDKSAAGRIIYAGSDVFNAVTGPAQMVAMKRLIALLSHTKADGTPQTVGDVQVKLCYQCDDKETAAFIVDDRYKQIVEGDFSRNDREQRERVAHMIDLWFEKLGFPNWYRQLMFDMERYPLTNFKFGVKVLLSYQLATGTTNTTFRNSCYNFGMFAVTCKQQNVTGKALVLGDDILACLNKRLDLKKWISTVADFKMVLKAKSPALNGEATILSRRIFANVEVPFMVPLLGKMLVRFNVRSNQNSAISDSASMAAKALSYAFGCQNVHLLRDIFLRRYEMEDDKASVSLSDLGWQTRSMGYTVDEIKRRTLNAPNLIDDSDFSEWCTDVYDLDFIDVVELFEQTVLDPSRTVLENPNIENMRKDYD